MKNFAIIAAAILSAAFTFASCKSASSVAATFDAIDREQDIAATIGNFKIVYHFEYLSALPDETVLQKVQRAMASDIFGSEYVRTDAVMSAVAFDDAVGEVYGIRPESTGFKWDGSLRLSSKATLVGGNIVAYVVERAEDNGGAHGMEETRLSNYDLRSGMRLTLNDLFTPEGKAALGETVRARILKDKGVATWEELMARDCFNAAAEVAPTENFGLSATDITFVYNPYDIACYAAGGMRVKLRLANLAGFKKEVLE